MELEESTIYLKKIAKEYKIYGDLDNPEFEDTKKIANAIETVLQALEKLQKHCKEMIKEKQELSSALLDSIPKKKIENQIEMLKAQCGGNVFHIQQTLNSEIKLLQELLEDK